MDRRTVLRGGLAGLGGVAGSAMWGCAPAPGGAPSGPFDCGVASGLHSSTASVLWTRFAPAAVGPTELIWQVATDPQFKNVVARGTGVASPDTDGCIKVLAEGLTPGTLHWYRFDAGDVAGPVGRTRTLPVEGSDVASVRLAVASCQAFGSGYYPAWKAIAAEDVDAVIFLGDYIYESGGFSPFDVRADLEEAVDLASYRAKYRLYKSDANLQLAHATHAFAPVWDDHELANDWSSATLAQQPERAAAAFRAWWEYQPVWPIAGDRIHRRLDWGRLLQLSLLDTRQYRDAQPVGADGKRAFFGATSVYPLRTAHDSDRTILGPDQRQWLLDGLSGAQQEGVTWKLVGNQVMISPIRIVDLDDPALRALDPNLPRHAGVYVNFDDWNGYQWERDAVSEHLHRDGIGNVGFLTGDIHSFWQSPVFHDYEDERGPVVAQEFVCGSISSRGFDFAGDLAPDVARAVRNTRPGFRYVNLSYRGYGLVECTPDHASVEFRRVNSLARRSAQRRLVRFDWPEGGHQVAMTRG